MNRYRNEQGDVVTVETLTRDAIRVSVATTRGIEQFETLRDRCHVAATLEFDGREVEHTAGEVFSVLRGKFQVGSGLSITFIRGPREIEPVAYVDSVTYAPHMVPGTSGGECATRGCGNPARWISQIDARRAEANRFYRCTECCDAETQAVDTALARDMSMANLNRNYANARDAISREAWLRVANAKHDSRYPFNLST